MGPAIKTLSLWRGNSRTFPFRLKQGDGTPVDLTGIDVVMTIVHGNGRVVSDSRLDGTMVSDPTTGEVTVKLPASVTRSFCDSPADGIRYELELQWGDEQTTVLAGKILIEGGANDD